VAIELAWLDATVALLGRSADKLELVAQPIRHHIHLASGHLESKQENETNQGTHHLRSGGGWRAGLMLVWC
jgi:hypothetical protein